MKGFTLYRSDCKENKFNTDYKIKCDINSLDDLKAAVLFDHVPCNFKDNHRADGNFISSDVICMDIDNDHSNNPEDWKTLDDITEAFPDVDFYYVESRNHMKPKKKESGEILEPRPKYHLYFPIEETRDSAKYKRIKGEIGALFPLFDKRCSDISHFFYAVPAAEGGEIE